MVFTSCRAKEVQLVAEELLAGARPRHGLPVNQSRSGRDISKRFAAKASRCSDSPGRRTLRREGGKRALWGRDKQRSTSQGRAGSHRDQASNRPGRRRTVPVVHKCAGYASLARCRGVHDGRKSGVEPLALWSAVAGRVRRRRSFERLDEQFLIGKFDPPAFALELPQGRHARHRGRREFHVR